MDKNPPKTKTWTNFFAHVTVTYVKSIQVKSHEEVEADEVVRRVQSLQATQQHGCTQEVGDEAVAEDDEAARRLGETDARLPAGGCR